VIGRQGIVELWGGKDLLAHLKKVPPRRLVGLLILILLSSLAEGLGILMLVPLIALLSGNATASAAIPEPISAVAIASPALLLAGFAALITARALLQQWQQSKAAALQRTLIRDLRLSAMRAILYAEWRWLSQQRISENSAVLLSDLSRLGQGIAQIPALLSAGISLLVFLIVCLVLSWPATLLALAFGVIAYAAVSRFRRRSAALGEAMGTSGSALHREIEEALGGIKLIKSLGREHDRMLSLDEVLVQLDAQHGALIDNAGKSRTLIDTSSAVFLALLTYAALSWLHLPAERLLPLIIVFARFIPLLAGLQNGLLNWLNAVPALRRVDTLIDAASACAEPAASNQPIQAPKSIRIKSSGFSYPGARRAALAPISLSLSAPSTIAITGPSGAGKSTLADILGGLMEPDEGALSVDGALITGGARVQWRQSVAYVQQDSFFFDSSIADNLRLANPGASDDDMRDALGRSSANFINDLPDGLATRMGPGGKRFSGGERQRIAFARALLASPLLLILDEATSALDPANEQDIIATVEELRGSTTIVVISHRLIAGLTIDQHFALQPQQLSKTDT
jgi:ATP-binding cassette, subfamily C, bacterial